MSSESSGTQSPRVDKKRSSEKVSGKIDTPIAKRRKLEEESHAETLSVYRAIQPDVKVVCKNGETDLISCFVQIRCPVFARMLDGSFKEGVEKIIRFEEDTVEAIDVILKYLQWGDMPPKNIPITTCIEVAILADRFDLKSLFTATIDLLIIQSNSSSAITIYELCSLDIFKTVRESSIRFIGEAIKGDIALWECDQCEENYCGARSCDTCGQLWRVSGEYIKCNCDEYSVELSIKKWEGMHKQCTGKITRVYRYPINIDGVSEGTLAEIMKKILSA